MMVTWTLSKKTGADSIQNSDLKQVRKEYI
jgi:hypothetical protein